jgi:hypothetical protein
LGKPLAMSKDRIKYEINRVLDQLPDKTLEDLLHFLQNFGDKETISLLDESKLSRILSEDKELLEKLAR